MTGQLRSWGLYPDLPQTGHYAAWRHDLRSLAQGLVASHGSILAYGAGRSYGDSPLAESGHVLAMTGLDRVMDVDWERGTFKAEAGISLGEIQRIALSHGWFLPVTPGTQYATLGGAIANDVHGKNHHVRGTFGRHVLGFGLYREGAELICSPSEHASLYSATIGGLGLTGIITWAHVQLMQVATAQIDTQTVRFGGLTEFFDLSRELDHQHEYSVAWVDCVAKGKNAGRGVFIVGDHASYGDRILPCRTKRSVALTPPVSLVNPFSLRAFNEVYWRKHPAKLTQARVGYEPFFYPLDALSHWNRIYGRKGFQQYQCVIPLGDAQQAIADILKAIADTGQGSFLAVLKRCGELPSPGLLSFPMAGVSLALDFPQSPSLTQLFVRLDDIVRETGGRLYPAKDAHMLATDFQAAYPAWETLERLRDPGLSSVFWKRVTQ
ncbi:FAD-binding oxidoreductase [Pseudomonas sp. DC3000-4b1]|uniref:FAD-binding oxidoreductase n=1 Tax=unclassified Pseudomonas TaxID=196821 RepID=UPI003CF67413